MTQICPTITAYDTHDFRDQLTRLEGFAPRLHLDFMDGVFAPVRSINLIQAYWPQTAQIDLHLMYARPLEHIETLVSLKPDLVIVHAEASGDLAGMFEHLRRFGMKVGVALLPPTRVQEANKLVSLADHVLIFGGHLGYQGGTADLTQLKKVAEVRAIRSDIELGWDGGADEHTINEIKNAGIDVINVGSAIHDTPDSQAAYEALTRKLTSA